MIVLIALVAVVSLMPASAETLEVRGTIVELDATNPTIVVSAGTPLYVADVDPIAAGLQPGLQWDYISFAGFWYDPDNDLQTETLAILANERDAPGDTLRYPYDREIGDGSLVYRTHPVFQEYELHANEADPDRTTQTPMEEAYDGDGIYDAVPQDLLDQDIGLCVESDNSGGDCGYFVEGWMGEAYVAIDNNADKLCELLVEFGDDDNKTLYLGEEWDLGGGFALEVTGFDATGEKATIHLSKNGGLLDTGTLDTSGSEQDRVYTYTADIGNEDDIPVFSCYVNAVYSETGTVEIMYVFLIDGDVLEIDTSDTYGSMEVMTASSMEVVLTNDETTIDLDIDNTEHIMGNMYFKTAGDDVNDHIRFYPYVEYTESGTYEVRGTIVELDAANPTLGADRVWDYSSFPDFWYDLDADLETETLTILEGALGYPGDREIDESSLVYKTHPVFQEYQMHQDIPDPGRDYQTDMEYTYQDQLDRWIGLCVESDNLGGDCGYFIEGWMGEKYVAIDNNADKLTRLLLEFEDDDKKTLYLGEEWDLGGGFALEVTGFDVTGEKATIHLSKNGGLLDTGTLDTGGSEQDRVYTYTPDIGEEEDIPVFSCYVDAIYKGDVSYVQLMYVFLIDDDVLEIDTSDTYGAMEVMTASSKEVVLNNDETAIDLDIDSTEHIMGDMYFKTADDGAAIRFYPCIERTIGGEEPTPPPATIPANDTDGDGVPDAWDEEADTPAGYWVNSDGIGRRWGDMNGDGELTSVDALMILQAAVGKTEARELKTQIVWLDEWSFTPRNPTIHVGDTLEWNNNQQIPKYDFVLVSEDGLWQNQTILYGKRFQYTFNTSENYTYYCQRFKGTMSGTVTVLE
jgi:S-layer protein (TIGR01567 family)